MCFLIFSRNNLSLLFNLILLVMEPDYLPDLYAAMPIPLMLGFGDGAPEEFFLGKLPCKIL
jgi:hypothetical protein